MERWLAVILVIGMAYTVCVIPIASHATAPPVAGETPYDKTEYKISLDALFTAAATIMGLAVFGSLLGMRIQQKPELKSPQHIAMIFVFICIIILIVVQAYFMWHLVEYNSVDGTWLWIVLTTLLLSAVAGFVVIANSIPKKCR